MESKVGPAQADHYAFTAGIDLSFRGLSRTLRKRQEVSNAGPHANKIT
jgi:hypothetical protein